MTGDNLLCVHADEKRRYKASSDVWMFGCVDLRQRLEEANGRRDRGLEPRLIVFLQTKHELCKYYVK